MTPKEKAKSIIDRIKENDYDWIALGNTFSVEQHAGVVLDEVSCVLSQVGGDVCIALYWLEVEKEIKKQLDQTNRTT